MGARIRAYDWTSTPLGPPGEWPQALKTSVRLLLSTGHPMFIWWGPELIQFYNDAYSRSIGPERHPSALGQRGRECWAEIWDLIGPQIEHVMAGRGYTWDENRLVPITRYGKREEVYWTYSYGPIDEPSAPNGVGGVLVICTETTAQILAERSLKTAEERWRSLFHQTPGFVAILTGPNHVVEFANARYLELVGERDVIGKPIRDALPEVEAQGFAALLDRVYASGEPHLGIGTPATLMLESGQTTTVYLDFIYQPIRGVNGEVTGIFVSGHDVTPRVIASEQQRDEDRRKDEFLAMLGHELRNPLAAIQNASELLTYGLETRAQTREVGELLGRQVAHLGRLVDDLLDVSRITQGRIELKRDHVELGAAIRDAIETVQPLIVAKDHQVVTTESPEPLYVDADRARIVQALANVLGNAAKYTGPRGVICVRWGREGPTAVIEIEDNGVGIPPALLPRVFDLFVQGDRSVDRSQGGLGIGLSVVRRLVEMHGGTVTAASEGVAGRGSTFTIRLPLVDTPGTKEAPLPRGNPDSQRVLVVDDNVDAADSLAILLNMSGHETKAAYDGSQALEVARSFAPNVVLLDIGLPGMDGYETAARLRAEHGAIAIVAVTGYGSAADVERARSAGFDAHITKPVAFDELKAVLAEVAI